MRKRIIALVVLMAMVIGMTSQIAYAEETATYNVGYAKVDINPYADGTGASQELLAIPMAGGAETIERLSESKADDTGDGKIDGDDGIFATCIAITDQYGKTVLLISCDLNNTYDAFLLSARQQIMETYADFGVEADRILINASHNHSGPMLVAGWENGYNFSADLKRYREHLVSQLVKVAGDALADRAPATMYKDSIDASENADTVVGNTFNTLNPGKQVETFSATGRAFNTVRHYQVKLGLGRYSWSSTVSKEVSYIAGDNFNTIPAVDANYTVDGTTYKVKTRTLTTVTTADDRMHVVKFDFGEEKDPIALVNWRAHATIAKGRGSVNGNDTYRQISGDYVTALRHTLAQNGYRAAFFQGASGNINPGSQLPAGDWLRSTKSGQNQNRHVVYGTELAEIALKCLNGNMSQINEDGGRIRSAQQNFQSERKQVSVFEYMAGCQYIRDGKKNTNVVYNADTMYYYEDANGNPLIYTTGENAGMRSAETGAKKVTAPEPVVITSTFHAGAMVDGYRDNAKAGMVLELNAVTIGDEFSLVTSAGEPFDYYNNASKTNMWADVGADFVLGYTNVGGGYLSSKETYAFNSEISTMATGSYETMSQNISEGTGEAVVEQLDIMLDFLKEKDTTETEDVCRYCGRKAVWTELSPEKDFPFSNALKGGHYYLSENITLNDVDAAEGVRICLNLNGHTLTVKKGFAVPYGTTLSLLGKGEVAGEEGSGDGGVFSVKAGGTLNLYEATLRYAGFEGTAGVYNSETNDRTIHSGGILYVMGTFNMYGGLVKGTNVYGSGGAMLVGATGVANLRGGEILDKDKGESFNAGGRNDDCIRNSGKVVLSGNAQIDEIYIHDANESTTFTWGERLVIEGKYTGSVNVRYYDLSYAVGKDIGDYVNADITLADIRINGNYDREFRLNGGNLSIENTAVCVAEDKNNPGVFIYSNRPYEIIPNLSDGSRVVLHRDVDTLTVNKNLHLELKGKTVNSLTVGNGYTVQVSDFATADYDITGGYGKVKVASGTVVGATDGDTGDVYIPVSETGGYTSYHAVDLDIDEMGLKAEKQGLYFKHDFKGDAKVKGVIDYYGIALSAVAAPTEQDMQAAASQLSENVQKNDSIVFTAFDGSSFGEQAATSVLVSGIMKTANGYLTNKNKADMKIYGRAYIKLKDGGTFVFGATQDRSLRQQLEGIDSRLWETLSQAQQDEIMKMYEVTAFRRVMEEWNLSNIPAQSQK